MSVPCECRCGCNLFQISVTHQVNGNDDTYNLICIDCGRTYDMRFEICEEWRGFDNEPKDRDYLPPLS